MSSCDVGKEDSRRIWLRKYISTEKKDIVIKYVSLIILVFQNVSNVLVVQYVLTLPRKMFLPTVAIFLAEIVKLIICILLLTIQEKSLVRCFKLMYADIIKKPTDSLKLCVPAVIYVVQNNLPYIALSNLSAATYLVTYQLKILTTAVFAVTILLKRLSLLQWLALVLLFGGIALVHLGDQRLGAKIMEENVTLFRNGSFETAVSKTPTVGRNPITGFAAVLFACVLSGFSGTYLEKILKDSDVSIWIRSIQLAIFSLPISLANIFIQDGSKVLKWRMLIGFDSVVWCPIILSSIGGITVAVVIKFADNIVKSFAGSVSIIVACIASSLLFEFRPNALFLVGTALAIGSIFMYNLFPYARKYAQASTDPPNTTQLKEEIAAA